MRWGIIHPACQVRHISDVTIKEIKGPYQSSRYKGAMEFKITCVENMDVKQGKSATNTQISDGPGIGNIATSLFGNNQPKVPTPSDNPNAITPPPI